MGPRGDHRGQSISILRQIRQRMPPLPNLVKVRLDHRIRHVAHVRPVPVRLLILIDQPCANPFAELRMPAAIEAQGVFHLKNFGQRHMPGTDDLFPHQMRRQRRAFAHGFRRAGDQRITAVALQADGLPGAGHVADVEQFIDLLSTR